MYTLYSRFSLFIETIVHPRTLKKQFQFALLLKHLRCPILKCFICAFLSNLPIECKHINFYAIAIRGTDYTTLHRIVSQKYVQIVFLISIDVRIYVLLLLLRFLEGIDYVNGCNVIKRLKNSFHGQIFYRRTQFRKERYPTYHGGRYDNSQR